MEYDYCLTGACCLCRSLFAMSEPLDLDLLWANQDRCAKQAHRICDSAVRPAYCDGRAANYLIEPAEPCGDREQALQTNQTALFC